MRLLAKLSLFTLLAMYLVSCDKADSLTTFASGSNPSLTASATNISPVAADSNKTVLKLTWTAANHSTDKGNVKYMVEIDSVSHNFSDALKRTLSGSDQLTTSYTAKELNEFLVGKGYAFNVAVTLAIRVTSSYTNNNEMLRSNVVTVKFTPYKIPPKVTLPVSGRLFIVGGATTGGWNNPVPTPSQELTKLNATTYAGIFDFSAGGEYLLLPVNGDWSKKYALKDNSVAGIANGGSFGYHFDGQPAPDDYTQNFKGPSTAGQYLVMVDFQAGKFTVTPFTQQHGLPSSLFIVGDATPGGWNNPVPVPSQRFTRLTSTKFQINNLALTAGNHYLLLPENGNWGKKFGVVDKTDPNILMGGAFIPEGQDIPAPSVSGNYKIEVDFATDTYKLTKL